MSLLLLLLPAYYSCNKTLDVNAEWKDITVVYGLLDKTEDTAFIKITKAFLGPGDALEFAKIPDSSNYPGTLEVRLDEYQDTTLKNSYLCDTITIHTKKAGDSVFYYPDQLMYYKKINLNENYTYKLNIKNKKTGKVITAQTEMVHDFHISKPNGKASFQSGQLFPVSWEHRANGKRFQLVIRFFYAEALKSDPSHSKIDSIDWLVFNNVKSTDAASPPTFDLYFSGDAFFSFVGANVDTSSFVIREASHCHFIITAAAPDLDTYIEVTEPSTSIVQEKPAFTNIVNGIGLFSSRNQQIDSVGVSKATMQELTTNPSTINRGFIPPVK
jgi:hypothetical protein